jgi:hypothetical protein
VRLVVDDHARPVLLSLRAAGMDDRFVAYRTVDEALSQ